MKLNLYHNPDLPLLVFKSQIKYIPVLPEKVGTGSRCIFEPTFNCQVGSGSFTGSVRVTGLAGIVSKFCLYQHGTVNP
jgi:hypothetical protein